VAPSVHTAVVRGVGVWLTSLAVAPLSHLTCCAPPLVRVDRFPRGYGNRHKSSTFTEQQFRIDYVPKVRCEDDRIYLQRHEDSKEKIQGPDGSQWLKIVPVWLTNTIGDVNSAVEAMTKDHHTESLAAVAERLKTALGKFTNTRNKSNAPLCRAILSSIILYKTFAAPDDTAISTFRRGCTYGPLVLHNIILGHKWASNQWAAYLVYFVDADGDDWKADAWAEE